MSDAIAAKKKLTIGSNILLVCERKEIAGFISSYMQYLVKMGMSLPRLQVISLVNLLELPKFLNYIKNTENFASLQKIRIFVDAGKSTRETQIKLEKYKNSSFLREFEDLKFYLFPGKTSTGYWSKGYLEDLLLKLLKKQTSEHSTFENLLGITEDYLLSANGCRGGQFRLENHSRHVLYAFFAGTERFVGLNMGEAVRAGAFELEESALEQLKQLFGEL